MVIMLFLSSQEEWMAEVPQGTQLQAELNEKDTVCINVL